MEKLLKEIKLYNTYSLPVIIAGDLVS